jgi:hypothetical protein
MWGGPGGGPGGNLIMLANNEVVQKELKMTDKQKAAVKSLADNQNTKRRNVMQEMRQQMDMAKAQATQEAQALALQQPQIDPSVDARGSGAGNALAGALNQRGYQPPIFAGQPLVDPALQQQAAIAQGQAAGNAVQAQGWQMMREAMQQLQHESERDLGRALDKNQVKRLREIQLQVEGPGAVLREDVAEKLELREDQHDEIQQIVSEANQARGQLMRQNFQFMRSLMPNQPGGGNPPDPGGQAADAADPQGGQGPAGGAQAGPGGGRGGRGGRGQRGGPGGQGGPRFDPEAMRKVMEQPEVKAKMEETRKEQEKLRDREYAMVYKAMDRRQVSAFKKMLGKPFDVGSLMNGFFRGPGQRPGQAGNTDQAKGAAPTDASKAASGKAKTDSKTAPASKSSTTPRRQSLRQRRGLGQQQTQDNSPN